MRQLWGFLDWIGRFQIIQAFIAYAAPLVWPVLYAMLTGAAGYFGGLPLMWVLMAASMAFMGGVVAIFFGSLHKDRNNPSNKLRYQGTIVNYDLTELNRKARRATSSTQQPVVRSIDKIQIGVSLHNGANFPIFAYLESAETEMEDCKPPRGKFPRPSIAILPGNTVFMLDDAIDMKGHPCEKLEGKMLLKIKYGFKGKEKYELKFQGRVEAMMRPEGFITQTYTHWDTDQI